MSEEKVTRRTRPSRGQNSGGRPRAPWHTEGFDLMVRSMFASGLQDHQIAALLFHSEVCVERLKKRLDRAEKRLPRNPRDRRARQALGLALQKMKAAKPGEEQLRAFIVWLEANLAVLEAEPAEHRDWLPEHIRVDPAGEIAAEIARTEVQIDELRRARERPRASRIESTKERRRRGQAEALASAPGQARRCLRQPSNPALAHVDL